MKDLIDELRACANGHPLDVYAPILTSAADALESQAREIERLKEGHEKLIFVRDDYKKQAHDYRARWASAISSGNAPVGAIEVIRAEFPLFDADGLDQEEHHCEWSMQHDRKRLHALLDGLNQPASAGDERETIRAVFLRNGFTIKEGQTDLKPYVYAAAAELMSIARSALSANHSEQVRQAAKFQIGDRVRKTKGSQWQGTVVGTYSTALTPEGYAVESSAELGSVQIYPAAALEACE